MSYTFVYDMLIMYDMSYTFVCGRESVLSTKIYPPIILNENEQYVLGLIDFMSYNTIPNVDQTNNKFHIDGYDITIPEGSYEVEDLSNYLTKKITGLELKLDQTPEKDETDIDKNAKGKKQNLVTQGRNAKARKQHNMDQPTSLIMRINNNTLKCEIKSNKVIHFEKPNTIAPLLGFTSKRLSPLKTHVAENPVHITKVNSICVECNIITNSYINENQGHIIHMFYPNVLPGYKIVEFPKKVIYLPVTNRYIDEIFIKIVDQDGRKLDTARMRTNSLPDDHNLKRKASYVKSISEVYKKRPCSQAMEILDYIDDMTKQIERLTSLTQEYPNTARPLKELHRQLHKRHAPHRMEHIREWLHSHAIEPIEKLTVDSDVQCDLPCAEGPIVPRPTMTDCGTQTDACHGPPARTKVSLEGVNTFADFQRHARFEWPERLYQKTTMEVSNPLDSKCRVKVVALEPNDRNMNFSIQRLYRDRYPDLSSLKGDFEVTAGTPEELWHALERVKEETQENDTVALHHVSYMPVANMRKMAEVIFRKTTRVSVSIYTTATKRERPTYGFIVSKKDTTYSQLLTGVEEAVSNCEAKEAVLSLRSTRDGNLLITIDKDQDAASMIKKAIIKDSGVSAKLIGQERQAVIHVRGMTSNTNKEHLKVALTRELGKWEPSYSIKQLRPMRNNTLAATVVLSAEAARRIIDRGNLKVGLVRCEVERRYSIRRCQRCWSYTHDVSKCDGPDRTGSCPKCGKKGHTFESCNEADWCAICEDPHRIGSGKCKEFRSALQRARLADQTKSLETPPPQAYQPPTPTIDIPSATPTPTEMDMGSEKTDKLKVEVPGPSYEEVEKADDEVFHGAIHSTLMEQFGSMCDSVAAKHLQQAERLSRSSLPPQNEESDVTTTPSFPFIDSFRFMSDSLDKLSYNLDDDQKHITRQYFDNEFKFNLVKRKGVFPYGYLDNWKKLQDTCLPPIDSFFSTINNEGITHEDYQHACTVWNTFEIKTLQEYAELYLKTDVLLLSDIFKNFRLMCLKTYGLDSLHYFTLPGLAFDAMLKVTNVELELLIDIDMVLFFEKAKRGGVSQ
ncbi:unnamed protein product [Diabrotica balteata]|uniref:CCHC-type domain-containing protein n=1 Tax=Diabrotica balteata TaxID=107213 RepID=A0A9N9TBE8_DIABA|nr:unnamed protein product [Diabrotica balteata]